MKLFVVGIQLSKEFFHCFLRGKFPVLAEKCPTYYPPSFFPVISLVYPHLGDIYPEQRLNTQKT
jgi:hypothetical protein